MSVNKISQRENFQIILSINIYSKILEFFDLISLIQKKVRLFQFIFILFLINFDKFWVWSPLYVMILFIAYFEIMLIYIFRDPDTTEKVWLIVHHLLILVIIYLIFKTSTTKPGTPTYFYTEDDPLIELRSVCKHCFLKKPLRCHLCKNCGKYILRMDHHEFWVNNCIGQNNYKYYFCLIFQMTVTLEFYICIYLIKIIKSPPNGAIDTYYIIFTVPLLIKFNPNPSLRNSYSV